VSIKTVGILFSARVKGLRNLSAVEDGDKTPTPCFSSKIEMSEYLLLG
jgi:hypothetical protein